MNNLAAAIQNLQNGQPVDMQSLSELEQQVIMVSLQLIAQSAASEEAELPQDLPPYEWAAVPDVLLSRTA
jgi:hypothetical protein